MFKESTSVMFLVVMRVCVCVCVGYLLSHVQLFATPLTSALQAPLSMGFSQPEYWVAITFSRGSSQPRN